MHVIRGDAVIQHRHIESPHVLPEFGSIRVTIPTELQQERAVMTSLRQVKQATLRSATS